MLNYVNTACSTILTISSYCVGKPSAQPVETEKLGDGVIGQMDQKQYIDKADLLRILTTRYQENLSWPIYFRDLPTNLRFVGNQSLISRKENNKLKKVPQEPVYKIVKLSGQ